MNNTDRADWIDNNESLYRWWLSSGLSKREFISLNRTEIDMVISKELGKGA